MDSDKRLVAYAKQNGQVGSRQLRLTPRQRRRYWSKWFCGVYIEPVFVDELTGQVEGMRPEKVALVKRDRLAPNPLFKWPDWRDEAEPGESFWAWMDRKGVQWC
jgi:hypothetical protein